MPLSSSAFLIAVVGDSLSLPRYFDGIAYEQTYPFICAASLRDAGFDAHVWHMSRGGGRIADLLARYEDAVRYIGPTRGIAIIQSGIVDCSPRPLPYALRRALSALPRRSAAPIIALLHNHRRTILKAVRFRFTGRPEFARLYTHLIARVASTFDRVYALTICPPGGSNASRSPGLDESIRAYNEEIARIATSEPRMEVIDLWRAFSAQEALLRFVSADGHHLTIDGHRWISDVITAKELARR